MANSRIEFWLAGTGYGGELEMSLKSYELLKKSLGYSIEYDNSWSFRWFDSDGTEVGTARRLV